MALTVRVTLPDFEGTVKTPLAFVVAWLVVPVTSTVAPATAADVRASLTAPDTAPWEIAREPVAIVPPAVTPYDGEVVVRYPLFVIVNVTVPGANESENVPEEFEVVEVPVPVTVIVALEMAAPPTAFTILPEIVPLGTSRVVGAGVPSVAVRSGVISLAWTANGGAGDAVVRRWPTEVRSSA